MRGHRAVVGWTVGRVAVVTSVSDVETGRVWRRGFAMLHVQCAIYAGVYGWQALSGLKG